jgi:hypothetical protein
MRRGIFVTVAVVAALAASAACAAVVHFSAKLDGASETPPNDSKGMGTASVELNTATKNLTWTVKYSGLSGAATMAHFHGPAAVGVAAGVTVPLKAIASPAKGSATLTDAQIDQLKTGMWYVNVHTAAHPGGEIRGQVLEAK